MWERLQPRQRELLMEIVPSFIWIRDSEYGYRFERIWRRLIEKMSTAIQTIEITNLPRDGDEGSAKSNDSMLYLARSRLSMMRLFGKKVVIRMPNIACSGGADSALVLFDDYVGTGNTVETALSILQGVSHSTAWGEMYVLAISAQRAAVARLESCGFTLIADQILDRGISDCPRVTDLERAVRVMSELSGSLGIQKRDWLGYEGTEALAALMRTPNNTFPVFWTNNKVFGRVWDAPFPRYTDSEEANFETGEIVESLKMPASIVGGRHTEEVLKVLECIRAGHPVTALVEWKIPYSRILHYLQSLLDSRQIEIQGAVLRLTEAGRSTLRSPAHKRRGQKREFNNDEQSISGKDKVLYVPKNPVK